MELAITFLGGLALFLYGMHMMSANLEELAGNKMKSLMERLASTPLSGALFGTVITALVQSSTAISVMAVGFVNSGAMTLEQSIWIILGANVGTTVTGQLIALDFGAMATIAAFIGILLLLFARKKSRQCLGGSLAGFGVLFIGLERMEAAMLPLKDMPEIAEWFTSFQSPFLGVLAGTVVTVVIQSSTASLGILQALAKSGLIGLPSAVYIVFGQNIGTCLTSLLASIGACANAKRTALIHLLINVIGTMVFMALCMGMPFIPLMERFPSGNVAGQIANVHTVFNVVTSLVLLPFGGMLAGISKKLIRR